MLLHCHSVITGTYDEYRYIYVDPMTFESDNKYNEYAFNAIRKGVVTTNQILGLCCFILIMLGSLLYAALLNWQIRKRSLSIDETKRESLNGGGVQRQNSGIMMARSTTVDSGYQAPSADGMLA